MQLSKLLSNYVLTPFIECLHILNVNYYSCVLSKISQKNTIAEFYAKQTCLFQEKCKTVDLVVYKLG